MKVTPTELAEVLIIEPVVYRDERGAFMETYNERSMEAMGLPTRWCQDNYSLSSQNVVRGIHYQLIQPQGKLVRVIKGAVLDVAVDLRRSSPTFGKHVAVELSEENAKMLWIPAGFGHGFAALTPRAGFTYKVTDYYSPEGERTLIWNDPDVAIAWPVSESAAIISKKDAQGKRLQEAQVFV
jgi:dTDP-4-dehydrorhamnose 3,5-epimerase